jgi:hypothetical protein
LVYKKLRNLNFEHSYANSTLGGAVNKERFDISKVDKK